MASLISFTTLIALVSFVGAAPTFDGRIVGGLLAPEHSFPFLVGLSITKKQQNGTFWCGGSLIAPNFVLTAAHCVYGGTTEVKVKLGTHDRKDILPREDVMEIHPHSITIHEQYNPNTTLNDIALIKLTSCVEVTDDIQLIQLALPFMDQEFLQGQIVTAAGWGKSSDNTTGISEQLRFVDLNVIDAVTCEKSYFAGIIAPSNICADGSEMRSTCSGDSGGPLVYQAADDCRYLVGLTSFGSDQGCEKGFAPVFTRITSYLDWIAMKTSEAL